MILDYYPPRLGMIRISRWHIVHLHKHDGYATIGYLT